MHNNKHTVSYDQSGIPERLPQVPCCSLALEENNVERLNVVLPNFYKNYAFGGIVSAMELAREISRHYAEVRFISMAPLGNVDEMFHFPDYVLKADTKISVESIAKVRSFTCHTHEIFFCTHWTTTLLWESYAKRLLENNRAPNNFYYFIQDYEPGFFSYGLNHSHCLRTYSHGQNTWAIFNSQELADYFHHRKIRFSREYVLLPSLHPTLWRFLQSVEFRLPPKPRYPVTIVIYGRPQIARNCFEAVVGGLYQFFGNLSESERKLFRIVSAGREHPDILLHQGIKIESVGKLTIEDYIELLLQSHIGISFMASPHPSYPPLEMATFGLLTITNDFECKNLSKHHPNIRSVTYPCPELLAKELVNVVTTTFKNIGQSRLASLPSNCSKMSWKDNINHLKTEKIYI